MEDGIGFLVSAEIFAGALAGYGYGVDDLPIKTRRKALTTGLWASGGALLGLAPMVLSIFTEPTASGFISFDFRPLLAMVVLALIAISGVVASFLAAVVGAIGRRADSPGFVALKAIFIGILTPVICLHAFGRFSSSM